MAGLLGRTAPVNRKGGTTLDAWKKHKEIEERELLRKLRQAELIEEANERARKKELRNDAARKRVADEKAIRDERLARNRSDMKKPMTHAEKRALRTPKWIKYKHNPKANQRMDDIYKLAKKGGKAVDHGLALLGKEVSGLDVPDNLWPMDKTANMSKGNRMPDDFLDWVWKHDDPLPGSRMGKKGRLSAWRQGPEGLERVPRSQGGFINANLLKNIGKVGLLGGAEMALNYLAPENPINQARNQGYDALKNIGLDIEGGIAGIENPMLRGSAHLANGLIADPLVTAFGAGNWLGDRVQEELRGEHATNRLKRGKYGMMGRFNQQGML